MTCPFPVRLPLSQKVSGSELQVRRIILLRVSRYRGIELSAAGVCDFRSTQDYVVAPRYINHDRQQGMYPH
jgi:hypothetical protein